MADEIPVRYNNAGVKIADLFMDLVPTTKVGVRINRGWRPLVHISATESELEAIYEALRERLET